MTSPGFLLKGIDISSIVEGYLQGKYKDIRTTSLTKLRLLVNNVVLESNVGKDSESEVYEFIDWSNTRQRVVTINHGNYFEFKKNNEKQTSIINNKVCHYCRCEIKGQVLGRPLRMEEHKMDINKDNKGNGRVDSKNKMYIYHVEGQYHSFNCMYANVSKELSLNYKIRNSSYSDSQTLVLHMFNQMYPGKKLKPSPDWRLLDINGGPLSQEDFDTPSYNFLQTPNIVLVPLKIEYHHCGLLS